jgi:hypothetical protein
MVKIKTEEDQDTNVRSRQGGRGGEANTCNLISEADSKWVSGPLESEKWSPCSSFVYSWVYL